MKAKDIDDDLENRQQAKACSGPQARESFVQELPEQLP